MEVRYRVGITGIGIFLLVLLLAGCSSPRPLTKLTRSQKIAEGKLFYHQKCFDCHGQYGTEGLRGSILKTTLKQVKRAIRLVPAMYSLQGDYRTDNQVRSMTSRQNYRYFQYQIHKREYMIPDKPAFPEEGLKDIVLFLQYVGNIPAIPKELK